MLGYEDGPQTVKLSATEHDVADFLRYGPDVDHAYIERVASMPGQGVASTFKFGRSYGFLRGLLVAFAIPFEEVAPGVWQKPFGLPTLKKAGSITAKKNAHRAKAQQLFPGVKMTHAVADALLIAEWGRRVRTR